MAGVRISVYTSRKIARLSIVCAILVVYLHSYSKELSASMPGALIWWVQDFVSQGISRVAVPFFFVVSGFLLFKDFPEDGMSVQYWWLGKLRKRLKTLCVPYFAWSLLGLCSTYIMTRFASTQIYSYDVASPTWWLEVLGITTPPKFMFHLWFIKTILLFFVFSPLIAAIVFRMPKTMLSLLFLCSVFRCGYHGDSPSNLMFFTVGMVAARNYLSKEKVGQDNCVNVLMGGVFDKIIGFRMFFTAKTVVCAWLAFVFLKVLMTRLGFVDLYGVIRLTDMFEISIMPVINMLGVAALWIGYDFLTEKQLLLDRIAPLSFFVYCLHWIILPWIGAITKRVLPFHNEIMIWFVPPTLTVVIAILTGGLMRKKLLQAYNVLTGGR